LADIGLDGQQRNVLVARRFQGLEQRVPGQRQLLQNRVGLLDLVLQRLGVERRRGRFDFAVARHDLLAALRPGRSGR